MTPKVKHFLWRTSNRSLPTMAELYRRHIIDSDLCPLCGSERETVEHALLFCPQVRRIWRAVEELSSVSFDLALGWDDVMLSLGQCSKMIRRKAFTLAWLIWSRRNKIVFDNYHMPDYFWVEQMKSLVSVFSEEESKEPKSSDSGCGSAHWLCPQAGWIKINVDAGMVGTRETGIGVVARDESGSVLAAVSMRKNGRWPTLTAELLAMEEGLAVAEKLGARKVVFESDCLAAIRALNKLDCFRNEAAVLVDSILNKAGDLLAVKWSHVRRSGNKIAHYLAKNLLSDVRSHWFEAIPICIQTLVSLDLQ